MSSNEDASRKRVYQFLEKHAEKPKSRNYSLRRILKLKECLDQLFLISFERRTGCGRKPKIMDKSGLTKLCKLFDHKCGISQRKGAKIM